MTDPIADMLTRIRNAYLARHKSLKIPHSRIKEEITKILATEEYITSFNIDEKQTPKMIEVDLTYKKGIPAIDRIERISKPGRRIYVRADKIPHTLGGYGMTILSTNKGVMTNREAKRKKVGGELVCRVW